MLYERWREIARQHRSDLALRDCSSGEHWTFEQLHAKVERMERPNGAISFPQGSSSVFVCDVLNAWRHGLIVCPLEAGQQPPVVSDIPVGAHLKMTSATTGTARLIVFSEVQLAADAENIVATMGLRPDCPNVGVISLAHSYGFSNLILPLLLHGIPLVLGRSPLPEMLRQALGTMESATLAGVPALWRAWHEAGVISSVIRLAISAGAPLPLPLETTVFEQCGLKIHNFYGSSECGGIAYDRTSVPRVDAACVGSAMCNVQLSINSSNCLEVRSKAVAQTYWPDPSESLVNGCFQTSDLVEIIDGNVYLRGRASDQINVAGRKVSPETIERALLQHDSVSDCLVFGVNSQDADRGDNIVACVVTRSALSGDSLKQFLLTTLPAWQVPREWWFVDSLAVNQRG